MNLQRKDLVILAQLQKVLRLFGLKPDSITRIGSSLRVLAQTSKQKYEIYFWFKLNKEETRVTNWSLSFQTGGASDIIKRSEAQNPSTLRRFKKRIGMI